MTLNNITTKEEAISALVTIFKEKKGLHRLFLSFVSKYKSYGRIEKGVSAVVSNPTIVECKDIGNLVGKVYLNPKRISISAKTIEKEINSMNLFNGLLKEVTLKEVLEVYIGENFITNKEEKEKEFEERQNFFLSLPTSSELFTSLINWILDEKNKYNRFFTWYKERAKLVEKTMIFIDKAFVLFPLNENLYLPYFSSLVTSDPHFFDLNREEGRMFRYSLQVIEYIKEKVPIKSKPNAEDTTELYYRFGILRDDNLNFTHIFNVHGINSDGSLNKIFYGAIEEEEMIPVSLSNLSKIKEVQGLTEDNTLYILENSSLCSMLITELKKRNIKKSILLSSGQIRVATLKLIDLFVENGGKIYYSGDFDPEGLGIAQKLLNRHPKFVFLWRYGLQEYLSSLSNLEIKGSRETQLLNNVTHPELSLIKKEMLQIKKIGYQESIFHTLLEDLIKR